MPRHLLIAAISALLALAIVAFVFLRTSPPEDAVVQPAPSVSAPPPTAMPATPPATDAPSRPAPVTPRRSSNAAPAPAVPAAPPPAPPAVAPTRGTLTVNSDVPGAQVFIDRRFIGNAPVTIDDLEPGQHRLNVSADGFDGIAETIDVEPGAHAMTVRFREVRLNAALPIVHRHRIGSCNGRLVAAVDGIRYETTDTNDAFSATFADIETFEVNYQERNLRIKLRKGREYNFTDPQKDADRLFVFHRDVERARALLAKGYQPATD